MHPNERLLLQAYRALANGDGRALAQLLTVDTQWIIPGAGSLAGVYTGPDEIFGFGSALRPRPVEDCASTLKDVLANDERTVVLVTVAGNRGDRQVAGTSGRIFEIRDARVTIARFIYVNSYDDFWMD